MEPNKNKEKQCMAQQKFNSSEPYVEVGPFTDIFYFLIFYVELLLLKLFGKNLIVLLASKHFFVGRFEQSTQNWDFK